MRLTMFDTLHDDGVITGSIYDMDVRDKYGCAQFVAGYSDWGGWNAHRPTWPTVVRAPSRAALLEAVAQHAQAIR